MDDYNGRVLVLKDGSRLPYWKEGAYGHIFVNEHDEKAYKLFLRERNFDWQPMTKAENDKRRREVFEVEVKAYEIASADPYLAAHTLKYFGLAEGSSVHDLSGRDKSHEYHLDCCYILQFLQRKDVKLHPDNAPEHINYFVSRCKDLGIDYVKDSSVFDREDPSLFKVIDFATIAIELRI